MPKGHRSSAWRGAAIVAVLAIAAVGAFLWGTSDAGVRVEATTADHAAPPSSPVLEGRAAPPVPRAAAEKAGTRPTHRILGRVVDSDGRPVAGARVLVWESDLDTAVLTDGGGAFALVADAPQVRLRCLADPPWVAREARIWAEAPWAGELVVVRACEVRVTVIDADTKASLAGARVRSVCGEAVSSDSDFARGARHNDEATTDATGRAILRAPAGVVQVYATAAGYGDERSETLHATEAGIDAAVALSRGGLVAGHVLDPEGHGIGGALLHGISGRIYDRKMRTATDGSFTFADVPIATFTFSARAAGWAPQAWECDLPLPGGTTRVDVQLTQALTIEGRTVAADGKAMAGVTVRGTPGSTEWFRTERLADEPAIAVSDAEGRFSLTPVAPGALYVTGRLESGWHFGSIRIVVPAQLPFPEITLRREQGGDRGFTVRLTDADGKPVPGSRVDALTRHTDGRNWARVGDEFVDAEGVARFVTGLPAAPVHFIGHAPGWAPTLVVVDLSDPRQERCDLRFASGQRSGRVRLADGSPAHVELTLRRLRPEGGVGEWMTDTCDLETEANGGFRLDALGDAAYSLSADTDGWTLVTPGAIRASPQALDLLLVPDAEAAQHRAVLALVDAATGEPLHDAAVFIERTREDFEELEDRPGAYRSPVTLAGRYDVRIKTEGRPAAVVPNVSLAPPRETGLRVTIPEGLMVEVRVTTPDGRPILHPRVSIGEDHFYGEDEDGTLRIRVPGPGTLRLDVSGHFVRGPSPASVVITDPPQPLTVHAEPAGAVLFRTATRHSDWREVEFLARSSSDGTEHSESYFLAADSIDTTEFLGSIGSLPPGRYHIEVSANGRVVASKDVDVRELEQAVVVVGD